MNLFYNPLIEGDTFDLDEQESRHAARVLRMGPGDAVTLVDGKGGWYEGTIEDSHPRRCRIKINSHTPDYQPLPYKLHIAISPTKIMERFEWFLEKATEIGITEITPLLCNRSERKRVNAGRLERIIISAMKQSLKAYKPLLNEPEKIVDFISRDQTGTKGIAHCMPSDRKWLTDMQFSDNNILLVGPEGDFTGEEIDMAVKAGYQPFHLGNSRLRTETAGVFLATAIQILSRSG